MAELSFDFLSGPASGDCLLHDLGKVANAVVLVAAPHIEDLIVNELPGRIEHRQDCAGNVLDVDDGTPGCLIAPDLDTSCCERPGDQTVEHEIKAVALRRNVGLNVSAASAARSRSTRTLEAA